MMPPTYVISSIQAIAEINHQPSLSMDLDPIIYFPSASFVASKSLYSFPLHASNSLGLPYDQS
jgi:hypothetical protein